jgi:hypothetical protein
MGRITGRPGRQHREKTVRLKSKAMGKPFEVTVMTDMPQRQTEEKLVERPQVPATSSADSGNSSLITQAEPTMAEVMESINALQPDSTVLEDVEYEELATKLRESYSARQLSAYLNGSLRLFTFDADEVQIAPQKSEKSTAGLQHLPWQPGQTPIDQRRGQGENVTRSLTRKSKGALALQIIRLAWHVSNRTDWQSVGELEVELQPWQAAYLFDLTADGQPMYTKMIFTPLLRENSNVQLYRLSHTLRITARRQDAEEVLGQLEAGLQQVQNEVVHIYKAKDILGKDGRPNTFEELINRNTLADFGRQTNTVLEFDNPSHIRIYGTSEIPIRSAVRLLLSWLDLPGPGTTETLSAFQRDDDKGAIEPDDFILALEPGNTGLHVRHRALMLGRATNAGQGPPSAATAANQEDLSARETSHEVRKTAKRSQNGSMLMDSGQVRQLSDHLIALPLKFPHEYPGKMAFPPWVKPLTDLRIPWRVQLCKLLRPVLSESVISRQTQDILGNSLIQAQIPQTDALLSYCVPTGERIGGPQPLLPPRLVAHFAPYPLSGKAAKASKHRPRIQVTFKSEKDIHPIDIRAMLFTQDVRVPLPAQVVDLRFIRDITMGVTSIEQAIDDLGLQEFVSSLKRSVEQGEDAVTMPTKFKFKLPGWLYRTPRRKKDDRMDDIEIIYYFDRFETVQTQDFIPQHFNTGKKGLSRDVFRPLHTDGLLRYEDIDAGPIYGQRRELTLLSRKSEETLQLAGRVTTPSDARMEAKLRKKDREAVSTSSSPEMIERLVKMGLGIASVLTRLSTEEMKPVVPNEEEPAKKRLPTDAPEGQKDN